MLNERELRRDGWQEGVWIELCDGQRWSFPEPSVDFVYDREKGTRMEWSFGPEYGALNDAAMEAQDGPEVIRTELALAHFLLMRNYDLTDEQFNSLVRYSAKDPFKVTLRQAISDVLNGIAPKP